MFVVTQIEIKPGLNLIVSLDFIRPTLGKLLFTLKGTWSLHSVGYREGAVYTVRGKIERQAIIPHRWGICDFSDCTTLLSSLVMTKNAIGTGKHLKTLGTGCSLTLREVFSIPHTLGLVCDCSAICF